MKCKRIGECFRNSPRPSGSLLVSKEHHYPGKPNERLSHQLAQPTHTFIISSPFSSFFQLISSTNYSSTFVLPGPEAVDESAVGKRVVIAGRKTGVLRFYGFIPGKSEPFAGIELDLSIGKHDGVVSGIRYFRYVVQNMDQDLVDKIILLLQM